MFSIVLHTCFPVSAVIIGNVPAWANRLMNSCPANTIDPFLLP